MHPWVALHPYSTRILVAELAGRPVGHVPWVDPRHMGRRGSIPIGRGSIGSRVGWKKLDEIRKFYSFFSKNSLIKMSFLYVQNNFSFIKFFQIFAKNCQFCYLKFLSFLCFFSGSSGS